MRKVESTIEEPEATGDPLELDDNKYHCPDWSEEDIKGFGYVNLPDGDIATVVACYDHEGEPIELEDAKRLPGAHVVAADIYLRIFQFNVREDTFNKVRLH